MIQFVEDAASQVNASLILIAMIRQFARTQSAKTPVNLQMLAEIMQFVERLVTLFLVDVPQEPKAIRKYHVILLNALKTMNVI